MKEYGGYIELGRNFHLLDHVEQIKEVLTEFQDCLPELKFSDEYRAKMADKFAKYAFFLVYRVDELNMGFSAFYSNDYETKTAYISFIAVAEKHREKRIGSLLLNQVFDIALQNGMEYIKLEVYKTNAAHSFYLKNGFKDLCDASNGSIYMIRRIGE